GAWSESKCGARPGSPLRSSPRPPLIDLSRRLGGYMLNEFGGSLQSGLPDTFSKIHYDHASRRQLRPLITNRSRCSLNPISRRFGRVAINTLQGPQSLG